MTATPAPAARQLIVCCDGTNNNLTGGARDTNVVKFAQLFSRAPPDAAQRLFYDPGVGNAGELPGVSMLDNWHRLRQRIAGLALGGGVYENMAQCYLFLMRHYQSGDQIFIFGFSRGAFTARSVAGLVNQFGILQPQFESMVETLIHIYFSERGANRAKMDAIARQASDMFASAAARAVEIQFVGVWDTVASVGMWPFQEKITATPTIVHKRYLNVRQALALDELRAKFAPRLYADANGTHPAAGGKTATLQQLWFRGSHGDVGGGYAPEQSAIANEALQWIVSEAVQCGLRLHDGPTLLATEAAVGRALARLHEPARAPARPQVHSMLRETCLWALTRMAVRDTRRVDIAGERVRAVVPVEHPSVGATDLRYPGDTSWRRRRPVGGVLIAALLALVLALVIGKLQRHGYPADRVPDSALQALRLAAAYLHENLAFQRWQLLWWRDGDIRLGLTLFGSSRWALVLDFGLIAAYAYVLAWCAVAAFARAAGLRRAQDPVPRGLNVLGYALPVAVSADIAENLATWIALSCGQLGWVTLGTLAGVAMSACAAVKLVCLLGTLCLLVTPARRHNPPSAAVPAPRAR